MEKLKSMMEEMSLKKKCALRCLFLIILALLLALGIKVIFSGSKEYLIHSLLEFSCIYIEVTIFLMIWNAGRRFASPWMIFGGTFLCTAIFDFLHIYYFLESSLFNDNDLQLAEKFWIVSRFFICLGVLIIAGKPKLAALHRGAVLLTALTVSTVITTLLMYTPFLSFSTSLSGPERLVVTIECGLMAVAFLGFYRLRKSENGEEIFYNQYFFTALLLIPVADLISVIDSRIFSVFSIWGHVLSFFCYLCFYRGIVINVISLPYGQLESQYKVLEEKIKEIDYLKEAKVYAEADNRNKSEYIANMSHELRTPLNVLLSGIQLFELYVAEDSSPKMIKMGKHLNGMKQNCLRQLRLVNNIIDTTKLDADYLNLDFRVHDFVKIIANIASSLQTYVASKDIKITFVTDVEEKFILCDADAIERIAMNLMSNAIKFTKPGGEIVISIRCSAYSVTLSVRDNGVGIPEDRLDLIFDRYKQVKETAKAEHQGSGIGLSLTKGLVQLHEGTIFARSRLGEGSEFVVDLPLKVVSDQMTKGKSGLSREDDLLRAIDIEFSDL